MRPFARLFLPFLLLVIFAGIDPAWGEESEYIIEDRVQQAQMYVSKADLESAFLTVCDLVERIKNEPYLLEQVHSSEDSPIDHLFFRIGVLLSSRYYLYLSSIASEYARNDSKMLSFIWGLEKENIEDSEVYYEYMTGHPFENDPISIQEPIGCFSLFGDLNNNLYKTISDLYYFPRPYFGVKWYTYEWRWGDKISDSSEFIDSRIERMKDSLANWYYAGGANWQSCINEYAKTRSIAMHCESGIKEALHAAMRNDILSPHEVKDLVQSFEKGLSWTKLMDECLANYLFDLPTYLAFIMANRIAQDSIGLFSEDEERLAEVGKYFSAITSPVICFSRNNNTRECWLLIGKTLKKKLEPEEYEDLKNISIHIVSVVGDIPEIAKVRWP